jgi:glycosyltransferase involved in cell wall biosynthesis
VKAVFLADAPYIHTRRWIEHFVEAGVQCEVVSFRPAEIAGARVHYVDGFERAGKGRYLLNARRVRRLVGSLAPDLVHALHLTSYGFLGALCGRHPLVVSVWGTDILEAPRLTPFHLWLTRYALERADLVTASGLHLASETTRYLPEGKPVTVVPYGVDMERFRPAETSATARETGLGPTLTIGTTARLSYEKGLPDLLRAFALLRARFGERLRLRIAGEGPERERLESLARDLGIGTAVEMRGWLEHADIPAFLHGLDIFVLASTYEGFGVSAVEASATGLPVVATDVYGIPDVVADGRTGLLVPPGDPAALAEAMGHLVEDAHRRRSLGRAGREYVAARYDWRTNAAQMDAIYARLLRPRPPATASLAS